MLNENRNPELTRQEIEEALSLYTGIRKVIWIGEGFSDDETDGHIDNIACFAPNGRVILGIPQSRSHPDYEPVMDAKRRLKEARDAQGPRAGDRGAAAATGERPLRLAGAVAAERATSNFYLPNGGIVRARLR